MKIYIRESVSEAVDALIVLKIKGVRIDYTPKPGDPEYSNAYIVLANNSEDIAVISSVIRWRKVCPDWELPEEAKACIQIVTSSDRKELIEKIANDLFHVVKED